MYISQRMELKETKEMLEDVCTKEKSFELRLSNETEIMIRAHLWNTGQSTQICTCPMASKFRNQKLKIKFRTKNQKDKASHFTKKKKKKKLKLP